MRARVVAIFERSAGKNAGARDEPPAVFGHGVVTEEHRPVAAEVLEVARCELELGAHDASSRVGVVTTMRFVEEGAARRDGGAEGGEERAVEEVHHEHERVACGR